MLVLAVVVPLVPPMVTMAVPAVAELLAVNVITLLPVVGLVPNVAVTPLGRPEADNVTAPVKPPVSDTVIVSVVVAPCVTESDDADGASVKLPLLLALVSALACADAAELPSESTASTT